MISLRTETMMKIWRKKARVALSILLNLQPWRWRACLCVNCPRSLTMVLKMELLTVWQGRRRRRSLTNWAHLKVMMMTTWWNLMMEKNTLHVINSWRMMMTCLKMITFFSKVKNWSLWGQWIQLILQSRDLWVQLWGKMTHLMRIWLMRPKIVRPLLMSKK